MHPSSLQFQSFQRPPSPRRLPGDLYNATGLSDSSYLTLPAGARRVTPHRFSEIGTPEQDMNIAADTPRGRSIDFQNATAHLSVDNTRASAFAHVSRSASAAEYNSAQMLSPHSSIVQQITHSAYPSNPTGFRQPLLPQHSAQTLGPHGWVAQQAPHPSNPSGFIQFQQPLLPQHSTQVLDPYGLISQQPTYPAYMGSVQFQSPLLPQYSLATSSQPYLNSEPPGHQYSQRPQHHNPGMFNQAHDFTVMGTFIDSNVTHSNTTSNQFMEKLLEKTIPGAASDSSARDPPPRCHPGTRLAIIERCLDFIRNCDGVKKMRWVVGAAGVGKSAIMQNVAESPLPVASRASVFYSVYGRNDGTRTIVTLLYQLAAKTGLYRQVIEQEITRDPSLLQSSMAVQFKKFIIEPFIHHPQLNSAGRISIIIDGLDECNNPRTQLELLRLISDFCITYPSSPIVWLIASRPETHITSFFSRRNIIPAYETEEILVDSNQAREDVERFLRQRLLEIKESFNLLSEWPDEQDLWKLANASGGLFAYAETAIRYIGDLAVANPASQLSDVLNVIENHPMTDVPREEHPMALLDALYARILSNVPPKVMVDTRKILWVLALQRNGEDNLLFRCNWLGMTPDEAYAAVNHLHSVLDVPRRDQAHWRGIKPFHKSFVDYISDFARSGFSSNIKHEAQQFEVQCTSRVLKEAPNGVDFENANYYSRFGLVARGPGIGDGISLTWPVDARVKLDDNQTRLNMYKLGIETVVTGIKSRDPTFQSEFCIRLLTTRYQHYYSGFPYAELCDLVFDQSRRHEFMMRGIIRQMPSEALDFYARFTGTVKLRFRRPATTVANLPDPWNSTCKHERDGEWEEGKDQEWTTMFQWRQCQFCTKRSKCQLEKWKTQYADRTFPTLFTSAGKCCIEFQCGDPEDGVSEWTYWFWYSLSLEERKKYGSTV